MWSVVQVSNAEGVSEAQTLTEHISGPAIFPKEFLLFRQSLGQAQEKLCPALDAGHFVSWLRLQALGELLDRQLLQPLLVHLILVVLVAREQSLRGMLAAKSAIRNRVGAYQLEHF